MKIKYLRWLVVSLITLGVMILFFEKQAFSVLWPFVGAELYPDKTTQELKITYASFTTAFVLASIVGSVVFGRVLDWLGTRLGFGLLVAISSLVVIFSAFVKGVFSFGLMRFILGGVSAAKLPATMKASAEWFPAKERALVQSVFGAGSSIAAIVSIPLIAYLSLNFSWQFVFILVGLIGMLWLIPWFYLVKASPESHPWITNQERDYILSGQQNTKEGRGEYSDGYTPSMMQILTHKQSWGVILLFACIEPFWLVCVTWFPYYLVDAHGMDLRSIISYGWIPYVGALIGALTGGLLARIFLGVGWGVDKTRKLIITLGLLIMMLALLLMTTPWGGLTSAIIVGLALFGYQVAFCNIQVLPADYFGSKVIGRLAGFILMIVGIVSAAFTAFFPLISQGGNYTNVFITGVALMLIALASLWFLCAKIEVLEPK